MDGGLFSPLQQRVDNEHRQLAAGSTVGRSAEQQGAAAPVSTGEEAQNVTDMQVSSFSSTVSSISKFDARATQSTDSVLVAVTILRLPKLYY